MNTLKETGSPHYNLFKHLHDEHDLILTESDLSDIANICEKEIDWDEMESNLILAHASKLVKYEALAKIFSWLKSEIKGYLS